MKLTMLALVLAASGFAPTVCDAGENVSTSLSVDALKKCANAKVAECQFRYGQALEGAAADLVAARQQYELAYQGGYEEAGAALLRLTRQVAPAHTATTETAIRIAAPQPPATPIASTPPSPPVVSSQRPALATTTTRNPGAIVELAALSDVKSSAYSQCWRFSFDRVFHVAARDALDPTIWSRTLADVKEELFTRLETREVRIVCQEPKSGPAVLLDGGSAVPLKFFAGERREKHFANEYQTSPTETTSINFVVRGNGSEGQMQVAVFPLGKDARVSRDEPVSVRWVRGDVSSFEP